MSNCDNFEATGRNIIAGFLPYIGGPAWNEKAEHLITAALSEAVAAERKAWQPLYMLALDYQMYHDGIMFAWKDKASPDAVEALEMLRGKLFAACSAVRDHTGLSGDQIAALKTEPTALKAPKACQEPVTFGDGRTHDWRRCPCTSCTYYRDAQTT